MKKTFTLCLLLAFGGHLVLAQGFRGKVVDEANRPIVDAYVYHVAGGQHSHTNTFGEFTLPGVSAGDTVRISFLGFQPREVVATAGDLSGEAKVVLREAFFELDQVVVSNSPRSVNRLAAIDLLTDPVNSSQEILRRVPGLFIGQHAGGGKAEQIFLRGFDIDHGTDISISVDGMPVNMVSHAHGQGYADLHWLIPETIEGIDFGKGPYYAEHGNFTTAGYVDFTTKDRLDRSTVGLEYGDFNTVRMLGMVDLLGSVEKQHAYLATEYLLTDGPAESPQNFNRLNLMGKYAVELPNDNRLSLTASQFQSKWDASGQIPQRLVDNGAITRFGAVDDTEGGRTGRTNLALEHAKALRSGTFLRTRAYYSQYDFELYSNFTFFLDDPINGDQIKQREVRNIYGLQSTLYQRIGLGGVDLDLQYGLGLRYDDVNENELSRTLNRRNTLERLALGNVDETNINAFVNAEFEFGDWLINPGLRLDYFQFDYVDELETAYTSLSENKGFVSPKLNIIYHPTNDWQFYLKTGRGFHSNDTRVVVAQEGREVLPAAYGADLGAIWKPFPRLWINAATWYLFLEQEFVYVGDAGIVEPSGRTERRGVDVGLRYQLGDYLFFDGDLNYTYARSMDDPEGSNLIPLAPDLTATGGLAFRHPAGWSGGIRYRFIDDRPANEDNSIVAEGYFVTDLFGSYTWQERVTFGFTIENLFDVDWNEAQFATESRLMNEAEPVEEIHFTPGVPFFLKGQVQYHF